MSSAPRVRVSGGHDDTLSALDRGLLYGDGLFETVLFLRGVAPLWPRHLARLRLGLQRLAIPAPDLDALIVAEPARILCGNRIPNPPHLRKRLLECDIRFQPTDDGEHVVPRLRPRHQDRRRDERHPHVDRRRDRSNRVAESRRHDAHDRHRTRLERDRPPDG